MYFYLDISTTIIYNHFVNNEENIYLLDPMYAPAHCIPTYNIRVLLIKIRK